MPKNATGKPRGRPPGTKKREHAQAAAAGLVAGVYGSVSEAAMAHIENHFWDVRASNSIRSPADPQYERFREFRDFIVEELYAAYDTLPAWVRYEMLAERRANRRKSREPSPSLAKLQAAALEASPRERLLTEMGRLKLLSQMGREGN